MDKVRLGRALGYGTRHAVRTLAAVAEAAVAPAPTDRGQPDARPPHLPRGDARPAQATVFAPRRAATEAPAPPAPPASVRRAGRSVWAPLATFSSALWLRVTGLFFALIALAMVSGAWRLRGAAFDGAHAAGSMHHFWMFALLAALFGYFAVSSFVRAMLRERR